MRRFVAPLALISVFAASFLLFSPNILVRATGTVTRYVGDVLKGDDAGNAYGIVLRERSSVCPRSPQHPALES